MEKKIESVVAIKVGTSTLTTQNKEGYEQLDVESFSRIGKQIDELKTLGHHVVLISSGAISAGVQASSMGSRAEVSGSVVDLQRLASLGWRHILNAWDATTEAPIGEVLLTRRELDRRSERNEALSVIHNLLTNDCLAVVNENDALSHEEITFGDNDKLAARLAAKMGRSALFASDIKLVILSDVDGVYENVSDRTSLISRIDNMDTFAQVAGASTNISGTGGMRSKFEAANIAIENGIDMWIANGREENVVQRAMNGEIGTYISAGINAQRIALATSNTVMI